MRCRALRCCARAQPCAPEATNKITTRPRPSQRDRGKIFWVFAATASTTIINSNFKSSWTLRFRQVDAVPVETLKWLWARDLRLTEARHAPAMAPHSTSQEPLSVWCDGDLPSLGKRRAWRFLPSFRVQHLACHVDSCLHNEAPATVPPGHLPVAKHGDPVKAIRDASPTAASHGSFRAILLQATSERPRQPRSHGLLPSAVGHAGACLRGHRSRRGSSGTRSSRLSAKQLYKGLSPTGHNTPEQCGALDDHLTNLWNNHWTNL